ncbi:MAG TPA: three-Cys-motif partner protein TcmP [Methylocella sp.]|nr:three-Cys-motif partner protein TcmP [Methylocella sp.]
MTDLPFRFDEIGYWSELKLEIIEKYGKAYTTAFKKSPNLKKYYIDAFSGAGVHISKTTGTQVEGSPARALKVSPPFEGFFFIDLDQDKTGYLRSMCGTRPDVHIHTGDSNKYLIDEVLPKIQYKKFTRALCLLDPYGLHLDWGVILGAGQSKAVDMFLNFPVMDMNMNAIWHSPDKAPREGIERMNRFWGDESWRNAAYVENPQQNFFGFTDLIKQDNDAIVEAFRKRLKHVGGFEFVPDPMPMRNTNNAVVYYLFFASQKPVAKKIIEGIFGKYRT